MLREEQGAFGRFDVGVHGQFGHVAVALVGAVIFLVFVQDNRIGLPVPLFFVWFMMAMAARNIPYTTLTTRVPGPTERARFQSIQSAVQHGASARAAGVGPLLRTLKERAPLPSDMPDELPRLLVGIEKVALIALALTALVPFLLWWVEARVPAKPGALVTAKPAA